MLISLFYFISGEEPYHGCTDIKPLLLLLLLLLKWMYHPEVFFVPCQILMEKTDMKLVYYMYNSIMSNPK